MPMEEFKWPDEQEVGDGQKPADKAAATETEVEVEVIDDTPEQDRGRPALQEAVEDPTDDEMSTYSSKVRERLNKLTHARHDERRKAEALERENAELGRIVAATRAERDRLQEQFGKGVDVIATQAKTLADTEIATAKAKLKAAHEAFDTDAIIEAQTELNDAQIKKNQAENIRYTPVQSQKSAVESRTTDQAAAPALDAKTSKWMSSNRWFGEGGDSALTGYALGLHQKLVAENGEEYTRTDEYFTRIDKAMRATFPDRFSAGKKPTSIVASAGRTAAGPRKVQLTSTQVALAKKLGMTPQQYAAEVVKLEKEDADG